MRLYSGLVLALEVFGEQCECPIFYRAQFDSRRSFCIHQTSRTIIPCGSDTLSANRNHDHGHHGGQTRIESRSIPVIVSSDITGRPNGRYSVMDDADTFSQDGDNLAFEEGCEYSDSSSSGCAGGRIANGKDAVLTQMPWHGGIRCQSTKTEFGSAILISTKVALTSRPAVYKNDNPKQKCFMTFGHVKANGLTTIEATRQKRLVSQILSPGNGCHPICNRRRQKMCKTCADDIALVKVSKPFEINEYVRPAGLPSDTLNLPTNQTDWGICYASGWGIPKHAGQFQEKLQFAPIKMRSTSQCQQKFKYFDKTSLYCGGGAAGNACSGDGGGPLMCQVEDPNDPAKPVHTVVGIISFGRKLCERNQAPTFFTRVQKHLDWIGKHMN